MSERAASDSQDQAERAAHSMRQDGRGWPVVGMGAALAIAVLLNALGARFDRQWDFTANQRYTPGNTLSRILAGLSVDVRAVVLLSHSDPLAPTVKQLLESYRLRSPHLSIEWLDPDRDPVKFLSRQSELGLQAGSAADDQPTSDAILVFVAGGRRYHIAPEQVVGLAPDPSDSTSHFEHAVAVALRAVLDRTSPTVCFTTGHRELSTQDQSPLGLSRLKERLERDTIATRSVDLAATPPEQLDGCRLVVVAAPDVALSPFAQKRLADATARSSLLLLGGVVPDSKGQLASVGLESLAGLAGIALGTDVVIERDDAFRLPNLFGETFLATPSEHPTTRGLLRGPVNSPLRVVVSLAASLRKLPDSQAQPLLSSSSKSAALSDVSPSALEGFESAPATQAQSHAVAMAGPVSGAGEANRRIAVMPANILQNRTLLQSNLLVTQAFGMSVIAWLLATDSDPIEFDARAGRPALVELSAQEVSEIARYTVVVMPACFFLAGLATYLLRRRRPARDGESNDAGVI